MMLRGTTWGDLRSIRAEMELTPYEMSSIDHLSDPDLLAQSLDKLDDEPYFCWDPREDYVPGPVEYFLTAARGYAVSLARHDSVLGTVEYRHDGGWVAQVPVDPPVAGVIHVTEGAVGIWDRFNGQASVRAFDNANLDKPYERD